VDIRIIKAATPDTNDWKGIISGLEDADIKVSHEAGEADCSIVLGGRFENPAVLDGEKILFYIPSYWPPSANNAGFKFFQPVIKEYYDEMIEVSESNAVDIITKYVRRKQSINKP
jgi:hypothetical protein